MLLSYVMYYILYILYLGSTIHRNGKFGSEISRKVGAAKAAFKTLSGIWGSAHIAMARRLHLLDSMVLSKLRYGVASSWLSKSDLRRLDGFHCGCLRKMFKIPVAFISRISNEEVRRRAQQPAFSGSVKALQFKLLGQVLMDPAKKVLKEVAFHGSVLVPATAAFVRKVGRPRHNWTEQLVNAARQASGSLQHFMEATRSAERWDTLVNTKLSA